MPNLGGASIGEAHQQRRNVSELTSARRRQRLLDQ